MSTSYAPPGESAQDLWEERSALDGSILASVAYGVHLTLFLIAVPSLLKQPKGKKIDWFLISFTIVMFVLGTIFIGTNTKINELMFIDDRNYPGGPDGYTAAAYSTPLEIFGNAVFCVVNWLADGLLIYRCLIIYNFQYWVVILPAFMFLGSISMSILLLFQAGRPNATFWTTVSVNFALPYFSLSLSLNIIMTLLIVLRLLVHRHRIRKTLGPDHATHYTSIVAMLVESSTLYSVFSLLFLISYARNSFVQNLFLSVLGQIQIISPLLIIIRVALGQGWSKDTAGSINVPTDIQFRQPSAISAITSTGHGFIGSAATGAHIEFNGPYASTSQADVVGEGREKDVSL